MKENEKKPLPKSCPSQFWQGDVPSGAHARRGHPRWQRSASRPGAHGRRASGRGCPRRASPSTNRPRRTKSIRPYPPLVRLHAVLTGEGGLHLVLQPLGHLLGVVECGVVVEITGCQRALPPAPPTSKEIAQQRRPLGS